MKLSVAPPIDKLLNGGVESGCITNFYGAPASGKTQVALQACVACAAAGRKVIYIDTEGGFSPERLGQISDPKKVGENIILLSPKSWKEQNESILRAERLCKKYEAGLIIVDSITSLWRLELSDKSVAKINKELAAQLGILSKLARDRNMPVLITNQIYSDIETGKTELSSKNIVKWTSKNIIELTHAGRTGCRIARIAKARALPEDKTVEFQIVSDGLKEVPWFKVF